MKTSNYQRVRPILYVLGAIILSVVFYIYTCEDGKNGIKKNDPIKAPAAFAFIDANVVNNSYVPNVTVTLIDPDSLVRTSSGTSFTELILKNGVMNLGLHYQATVNEKEPYRYRIKAEAPGYVTTMETVFLTNEKPGYFPVFMVKLATPPPGVGGRDTTLPVNSSGYVTADIAFETTGGTLANSKFTISIPEGTQLLSNCKGVSNPTGEAAKIQLASFDPTAPNIGKTFPNGFLVTDATNENGEVIASPSEPFLFASAGWISANIKVGDLEVDSFSKPVEGTMTIDPKLINPDTNKEFQVGDTVPIWSLDEDTGNWRLEDQAMVKGNSAELFVKFAMTHLSIWNLDYNLATCSSDIAVTIVNPNLSLEYYVDIVRADTGKSFCVTGARSTALNWSTLDNGPNYIRNVPNNIPIAMLIYDQNPPISPLDYLVKSQVIEDCNVPQIDTIVIPSSDATMCTNLNVNLSEGTGNPDYPICNNAIWYKLCNGNDLNECEDTFWKYAGVLQLGSLTTHALSVESTDNYYHFLIWYNNHKIRFSMSTDTFEPNAACGSHVVDNIEVRDAANSLITPSPITAITINKTCSRGTAAMSCPADVSECNNCEGTDFEGITDEATYNIEIGVKNDFEVSTCEPPV